MKGIQYLVDDQGNQTSVLIDLQQWGELWEDFYDVMIAHERADEPEIDWEDIKTELDEEANLESVKRCLPIANGAIAFGSFQNGGRSPFPL